jgi:hypothetical protein
LLDSSEQRLLALVWGTESAPRLDSGYLPKRERDLGQAAAKMGLSRRLVDLAWERFSLEGGGRLWADPPLPAMPAEPVLSDSPLPSPAAILLHQTLMDSDKELVPRARHALNIGLTPTARNPFVFATQAILYLEQGPDS